MIKHQNSLVIVENIKAILINVGNLDKILVFFSRNVITSIIGKCIESWEIGFNLYLVFNSPITNLLGLLKGKIVKEHKVAEHGKAAVTTLAIGHK